MFRKIGIIAMLCITGCGSPAGSRPANPTPDTSDEPIERDGVSVRTIASGVFRDASVQGWEIDVVNSGPAPATCDVLLVLRDGKREVARSEHKGIVIDARTRRGFRAAEPLTIGTRQVDCVVTVNSVPLVDRTIEFESSGPYRLFARYYLLSRNGVQVKLEMLQPPAATPRFVFKLLDERGRKVLFRTEDYRLFAEPNPFLTNPPINTAEAMVLFGKQPPDKYLIQVDVLEPEAPEQAAHAKTPRLIARLHTSVEN